jgi:hypothetical protein
LLASLFGIAALVALYITSVSSGHLSPVIGLISGAFAVFFGVIGWRRRRYPRRTRSGLLPVTAMVSGAIGVAGAVVVLSGVVTSPAAVPGNIQAAHAGETVITPPSPTATTAPFDQETTSGQTLTRVLATRTSMAVTLDTLAFVLAQERSSDGLESPALAVTGDGGVVDPFSTEPHRILVTLPANTTLSYTVSPDRRNYALTLVDAADPGLVARYDTVNRLVEFG